MQRAWMTFFLVSAVLTVSAADSSAISSEKVDYTPAYESKWGIGFSGGSTSGIGFAFRKHFSNRLGVNVGLLPLGGKSDYSKWIWVNLGGQAMYTLHQAEGDFFRLYGLVGGSLFISGSDREECTYSENGDFTCERPDNLNYYNVGIIGAGIGMEFVIIKRIAIGFDVPLSASFTPESVGVYPIPNLSLVYYVN